MHVHALSGCTPTPLAHYLKGLAVLRLVSEQRDPSARGWWRDECFHLSTMLDRHALVSFFVHEYSPSPITSPWNKGAGFVTKDDAALTRLATSRAARFSAMARGIAAAQTLITDLAEADATIRAIKAETKLPGLTKAERDKLREDPDYKQRLASAEKRFAVQKASLIPRCRLAWRGAQRQWMDAAIVLGDGENTTFPALLGTGGNDGNFDFTNNFYQRLGELFDTATGDPRSGTDQRITAALWTAARPEISCPIKTGQNLPAGVGGANSSNQPMGDGRANPMDFVLMLEGALMFAAATSRRLDVDGRLQASVPFAVRSAGSGYASAAATDEGGRGEQWLPLWNRPSSLSEIDQLLSEGRARVGGAHAKEPLSFAKAVARLGTARGVSSFERFGYIERNGQSKLAVPLGRFRVPDQAPTVLTLLDNLDAWHARVRRQARDQHASARLQMAERQLSDRLFAVVEHPREATRWQAVLLAMTNIESIMATGSGFAAGPMPRLDIGWVTAANDPSPEFRLAVAFARQGTRDSDGRWDGVRRHWLPMKGSGFATSGDATSLRLQKTPDCVITGRDGISDAIAVAQRRLVEASHSGNRHVPLEPGSNGDRGASLSDLALLTSDSIDVDRTMALARSLMALDPRQSLPETDQTPVDRLWPDDAWLVVRLAFLPGPLDRNRYIKSDPAMYRRLASGDAAGAFDIASRRLRAAGVVCPLRFASVDADRARLWAAALTFPINRSTARSMARRLDPDPSKQSS